jgi:Spy/CpxP family protein refolding chaperone
MNAKWIIPVIVAVSAAGFGVGRASAPAPGAGGGLPAELDTSRLARALNLSPDQAAAVRELGEKYRREVTSACDAHCRTRCELARLMATSALDDAQARQAAARLCDAQSAMEMATVDHVLKVREVLNPEQRAKYQALFGACICEECSAGGSCCPTGAAGGHAGR